MRWFLSCTKAAQKKMFTYIISTARLCGVRIHLGKGVVSRDIMYHFIDFDKHFDQKFMKMRKFKKKIKIDSKKVHEISCVGKSQTGSRDFPFLR